MDEKPRPASGKSIIKVIAKNGSNGPSKSTTIHFEIVIPSSRKQAVIKFLERHLGAPASKSDGHLAWTTFPGIQPTDAFEAVLSQGQLNIDWNSKDTTNAPKIKNHLTSFISKIKSMIKE